MTSLPPNLIVPIAAFLLGSIPFGYILVRWRTGGDIRARGSGNIGATNVLRTAGPGLGLLTLGLDAAKGALAIGLARHFTHAPSHGVLLGLALALVVLGHLYTPWLRFQGGKGVATSLGALLALAPAAMLVGLGVFAVVLGWSRYVSLASMVTCVAVPLLILVPSPVATGQPLAIEAAVIATAALILMRHRANFARLRQGTESKLGSRRAVPSA